MARFTTSRDYTLADWLGKRIAYTPKHRVRFNEIGNRVCQALEVKNDPGLVDAISLDVMSNSEFEDYGNYLVSSLKNRKVLTTLPFIDASCKLIYSEDVYEKGTIYSVDKYVIMTIRGEIVSVFIHNEGGK